MPSGGEIPFSGHSAIAEPKIVIEPLNLAGASLDSGESEGKAIGSKGLDEIQLCCVSHNVPITWQSISHLFLCQHICQHRGQADGII